jgi:hypothetical protein
MKEKFVEVSFEEENRIITAQWIGYLRPDDVRTGCRKVTEFISKNNISKHISNQTQLKVLSKEVQAYLTEEWFTDVARAGLKKIAIIVANDIFAQATVSNVNTKAGNLQICAFHSEKDAIQWLNEVE